MTQELRAPQLVFVYGSLKRERGNARLLSNPNDAMYCGEYLTRQANYRMYSYTSFPALALEQEVGRGYKIQGEVYLVTPSMLRQLDRLEGHPDWYSRKRVFLEDGSLAWCYVVSDTKGLPLVRPNEEGIQEWLGLSSTVTIEKGIQNVSSI